MNTYEKRIKNEAKFLMGHKPYYRRNEEEIKISKFRKEIIEENCDMYDEKLFYYLDKYNIIYPEDDFSLISFKDDIKPNVSFQGILRNIASYKQFVIEIILEDECEMHCKMIKNIKKLKSNLLCEYELNSEEMFAFIKLISFLETFDELYDKELFREPESDSEKAS